MWCSSANADAILRNAGKGEEKKKEEYLSHRIKLKKTAKSSKYSGTIIFLDMLMRIASGQKTIDNGAFRFVMLADGGVLPVPHTLLVSGNGQPVWRSSTRQASGILCAASMLFSK